jgi:hypothetical protein
MPPRAPGACGWAVTHSFVSKRAYCPPPNTSSPVCMGAWGFSCIPLAVPAWCAWPEQWRLGKMAVSVYNGPVACSTLASQVQETQLQEAAKCHAGQLWWLDPVGGLPAVTGADTPACCVAKAVQQWAGRPCAWLQAVTGGCVLQQGGPHLGCMATPCLLPAPGCDIVYVAAAVSRCHAATGGVPPGSEGQPSAPRL